MTVNNRQDSRLHRNANRGFAPGGAQENLKRMEKLLTLWTG